MLACFVWLWLEMYSRKFGLRLRGNCGNLLSTRGLPGCHGSGAVAADWAICETGMRSRFHVNESSFRLAACAPLSGKPAKGFGVTAAAADLLFWARNPPLQGYGAAGYLLAALAAATILSKRLSPRKESQHGLKRRSPYVGPAGIVATVSSCSSARSRSPVHA